MVVETGEVPKRGGGGGAQPQQGLREKRIPDEKRSTTPYLTKYERARVLGVRSLQIRYLPILLYPPPSSPLPTPGGVYSFCFLHSFIHLDLFINEGVRICMVLA